MITWGVSAGGHDAALSILRDDAIIWASHSERFNGIKNSDILDRGMIDEALSFGKPDLMVWHEKDLMRKAREIRSGQYGQILSPGPRRIMNGLGLKGVPLVSVRHHHSHAAASYYTSGLDSAAVIVLDAVGEWDTMSVWKGRGNRLECVASVRYPDSLGLFYTAMTQRCGFKPNEEEYILMGMSAFGTRFRYMHMVENELLQITDDFPFFKSRVNFHRGIMGWRPDIKTRIDLAAAAQVVFETAVKRISRWAHMNVDSNNLVLGGGCALNCVANTAVAKQGRWKKIWIMPNPGDAGNSLGAALAHHGRMVRWDGPYLGHEIAGSYPVDELLRELLETGIAGVANGRAEFGPRALGNRSLLADPRPKNMRKRVNRIKGRESFRPFAPVVLQERVHEVFETLGQDLSYMQFAVRCKKPHLYPAIIHVDDTSRVQTVNRYQHPGLHELLTKWYEKTGCPLLLNTSLNIKGKPMVNDERDAIEFQEKYGVKVFLRGSP